MEWNEHVRDWVRALRSGTYGQTNGVMKRTKSPTSAPPGYCCLGVAAELAGCTFKEWGSDDGRFDIVIPDDALAGEEYKSSGNLPEWLKRALTMTRDDIAMCINMNDTWGFDFKQIADVVALAAADETTVQEAYEKLYPGF